MIKRNLWKMITSSLVTLSPILFGVIFWDALPDTIGTHFGPDGMADGTSGKLFAVLFMPLILFAFNWVCMIITDICDRKSPQSDKVYSMLFFMFPSLSMLTSGIVYAVALGFELSIGVFVCILFGVMFVVFGNYMPKVTRNRMIGIKIKDDGKPTTIPVFAPVGYGNIDFKALIPKMKAAGTEYFIVEQDNASDHENPLGEAEKSVNYIKKEL